MDIELEKYKQVLIPFREEMQGFFEWCEEERVAARVRKGQPVDLLRRPTTGIQLHTPTGRLVCIRPGWENPKSLGQRRRNLTPDDCKYGTVKPWATEIELIERGRNRITLELVAEGNVSIQRYDPSSISQDMKEIVAVCDQILRARRWELFARSSEVDGRCIRCRKELSVDDSLKHGVGPECIKSLSHFIEHAESDTVKVYKAKYHGINEPWEANCGSGGQSSALVV